MTLELDDRRVRVFPCVIAVPATSRVIQDSDSGAAILLPGQPRQVEFLARSVLEPPRLSVRTRARGSQSRRQTSSTTSSSLAICGNIASGSSLIAWSTRASHRVKLHSIPGTYIPADE